MSKLSIILYFIVALFITGCRSSTCTIERATPIGSIQRIIDKRVQPDASLRKTIEIIQVNEGIVSGNLTKIQVILHNKKSTSRTINYSWEWFDQNGIIINSISTTWKPLRLIGKEKKAISAVAPKPQAVDFLLKLQEPRPFLKRNKLNPFTP